ncbi:hypothetical protein, partial [Streptomyces sp. FH025]|uniref:hypothetical protein n=1 Tax=Streptomyces sp. FH025 TaxID=2815937 RepID=UPI001A9FA3F2
VRVRVGRNNQTYVECQSCGYRKRSFVGARDKAEAHLWSEHGGSNMRREYSPWLWIRTAIGLTAFLVFLFTYVWK